ncbi:septum formation family protein [Promicromonospora thailandica]|uniref:Interferon-induced transmembrane protein n=1 Tax=Promicromonospora thailandica TaxID=765201 RepID=A0A9X2JWA6_9MICO|nr:septum formation family protein [Promicromonospora thailandica]MCP2264933.1 Interferon-induced transmembrane protein [Promicromonospora thailandica]BFF18792.1 hypothetical protein GCM10025730_23130 [Promicromonospora thailandica]
MADTTQTARDADGPEEVEPTPGESPDSPETGGSETATAEAGPEPAPESDGPEPETADDDTPTGPSPTRIGWVVAAFLFFWPLAIPALVLSMRTAEANATGSFRRARKSSVHTLDFALGGVTVGVVALVALVLGVVAAPTYASSLPPGLVSAARELVPPALAGPLGLSSDDGADLAAPSPTAAPSDDPFETDPYETDPYADDPYAQDPYAEDPYAEDPYAEAGDLDDGSEATSDEPTPGGDTTATTGAEIPDLEVGDCFDTAATAGRSTLYRIPVVPCTTAHGGEIYAETTAPDDLAKKGQAPTQQALWDAADAYCYPQFATFVGLRWARSELQYWPIAPSEESWAKGDRRILCVVESETPVTGTLRDAER